MIYVMSDLHGEYDKFIEMLNVINFSNSDKLYILGDVLDRGAKSLEIIDYIRRPENSNIKLLMGNHEEFCLLAFLNEGYLQPWINSGGLSVYRELQVRGAEYTYDFLNYLSSLPKYEVVNDFILVHAGIEVPENFDGDIKSLMDSQNPEILLWDREFVECNKYIPGYTVICGHTPTTRYMQYGKKGSIVHRMGKILIDCGAHFFNADGRLGCLRLDDLKEFYVN